MALQASQVSRGNDVLWNLAANPFNDFNDCNSASMSNFRNLLFESFMFDCNSNGLLMSYNNYCILFPNLLGEG